MNILAIESSGFTGSAAILSNDKIIGEFTTNNGLTHGENLMPLIDSLFKFTKVNIKDIDYIACASGPGSFVGLRIGASIAKSLAHSVNIPIIPVPTLDAIAYNVFGYDVIAVPIIDAKKNQLYTSYYHFENGEQVNYIDYSILEFNQIISDLSNSSKEVIFLGEGVTIYEDEIKKINNFRISSKNNILQKASSVGLVGLKNINKSVPYYDFKPFYIRVSQAERDFKGN